MDTKRTTKGLEKAVSEWKEFLKKSISQKYPIYHKSECIRAINSLNKEIETGIPHCTCHLLEYKDCPEMSK